MYLWIILARLISVKSSKMSVVEIGDVAPSCMMARDSTHHFMRCRGLSRLLRLNRPSDSSWCSQAAVLETGMPVENERITEYLSSESQPVIPDDLPRCL